jgi:hypothetical protein
VEDVMKNVKKMSLMVMVLLGWAGSSQAQVQSNCRVSLVRNQIGEEFVRVQKDQSEVLFKRVPQANGATFHNFGRIDSSGQIADSPAALACSSASQAGGARLALPTASDAGLLMGCLQVNQYGLTEGSRRELQRLFPAVSRGLFWTSTPISRSYTANLMDLHMWRMVGGVMNQDYSVLCKATR